MLDLTAIGPRQFFPGSDYGSSEVHDAVGHDDVVVDGHDDAEDDHRNADTLKTMYNISI